MKPIKTYDVQTFPLFCTVESNVQDILREKIRFFSCQEEDVLYDYEEEAESCFFVFQGAVKQQNYTMDGKYIHLSYHVAGDYFGYAPAFDNAKRVCRAICSEDSVIGALDNQSFRDVFLNNKGLALDLIQKLVGFSNEQILMRSGKQVLSAHEHIILDLLRRRTKRSSDYIDLPPRKEWAAYLGLTPETLSREMTGLKSSGAIKLIGNDVEILDRSILTTKLSSRES